MHLEHDSMPPKFQKTVETILHKMTRIFSVVDDILIATKGKKGPLEGIRRPT